MLAICLIRFGDSIQQGFGSVPHALVVRTAVCSWNIWGHGVRGVVRPRVCALEQKLPSTLQIWHCQDRCPQLPLFGHQTSGPLVKVVWDDTNDVLRRQSLEEPIRGCLGELGDASSFWWRPSWLELHEASTLRRQRFVSQASGHTVGSIGLLPSLTPPSGRARC